MSYREPTLELPTLPSHKAATPRLDTAEQDIRAMLANYRESGQIKDVEAPRFDVDSGMTHQMAKFKVKDVNLKIAALGFLGAILLVCTGFLLGQLV